MPLLLAGGACCAVGFCDDDGAGAAGAAADFVGVDDEVATGVGFVAGVVAAAGAG
jgi:hypothetical protein